MRHQRGFSHGRKFILQSNICYQLQQQYEHSKPLLQHTPNTELKAITSRKLDMVVPDIIISIGE